MQYPQNPPMVSNQQVDLSQQQVRSVTLDNDGRRTNGDRPGCGGETYSTYSQAMMACAEAGPEG